MIGAGAFDRRITIQRAVETRDAGTNAVVTTWAAHLADVPASVKTVAGREFLEGNQIVAERRAVFTVRHADLRVTDRVIFDGADFNVTDIREVGRRRFLELQCEAVT
jgi:SPP1 family predicted phage head-tail adaptor